MPLNASGMEQPQFLRAPCASALSQTRIPSQNPPNPNLCPFKALSPCPATPSLAKSHPPDHLKMLFGKLISYLGVFLPGDVGLWVLTTRAYADYCNYYYFFTHFSRQFPPWKVHSAQKITIKAIYNIPVTIRWQEYKQEYKGTKCRWGTGTFL